jgi:hypothetical protein
LAHGFFFGTIHSIGHLVHRLERCPDKTEARGSIPRMPTTLYILHLLQLDSSFVYTNGMKENYWFRAHRYGYGWSPSSWQGWIVIIAYLIANIYFIAQAIMQFQSEVDIFMNIVPKVFIFSALLIIITYLKGEPVAWRWGKKKK